MEKIQKLYCGNYLCIINQFGIDTWIVPLDEEHFKIKTVVTISGQFFGWLTGLGRNVTIMEPDNVKQEYRQYLQNIMEDY